MRDISAWIFQTWAAVILSSGASLYGIIGLKDQNFLMMTMAFFFCVFAAISLQKMIRDNRDEDRDTTAYRMSSWSAFFVSSGLTTYCLKTTELEHWHRMQLITSFLFVISSVFVLSKTIRDQQEYERIQK
jgi:hypothetical protein